LTLRITDKGSRSFCWHRKVKGRPVRIFIGRFPGISVGQARKVSEKLTADVADGKDPQAKRRSARDEPTLADLFASWMRSHAKPHKRTWEADQRQYPDVRGRQAATVPPTP